MSDDIRDQLPDDLNAVGYAGPYQFPDNSRRRKPAAIYAVLAIADRKSTRLNSSH